MGPRVLSAVLVPTELADTVVSLHQMDRPRELGRQRRLGRDEHACVSTQTPRSTGRLVRMRLLGACDAPATRSGMPVEKRCVRGAMDNMRDTRS